MDDPGWPRDRLFQDDGFLQAMRVSCYSLIEMARLANR